MTICTRTTPTGENLTRSFATYAEAYAFCLREGDASRLWSIEQVA